MPLKINRFLLKNKNPIDERPPGYKTKATESYAPTVGHKIKKIPGQKSISLNFFGGQIAFFTISKLAKNQFLIWEKV